jgi:hypothetical protein
VALLGLSDRPKSFRRCIQNTLGLRRRLGQRWGGRRHLLVTVRGKNRRPETHILDHVASSLSMDPLVVSLGQPRTVQPDNLVERCHSQLEQLCSVLRLVRMPMMLHTLKRLWERADGRKGLPRGVRPALKGPSAGAQRGYANLGKLILRQGLLIPWYLEDRDCDYLHVPRLVAALAANAANPSSNPESFAM